MPNPRIPYNLNSHDGKREVRFKLSGKYGWVCWYCNLPLPAENENNLRFAKKESRQVSIHIDHIIPESCGGTDDIDNLALACEFCNRAKLNMSVETFLTWLDRIRYGDTWCPIRDGKK